MVVMLCVSLCGGCGGSSGGGTSYNVSGRWALSFTAGTQLTVDLIHFPDTDGLTGTVLGGAWNMPIASIEGSVSGTDITGAVSTDGVQKATFEAVVESQTSMSGTWNDSDGNTAWTATKVDL